MKRKRGKKKEEKKKIEQAKEDKKIIKRHFQKEDKMLKKHAIDVKTRCEKELKRRKQVAKMERNQEKT